MASNKLTELTIRKLKYSEKNKKKHHDGNGLYLLLRESQNKLWQMKYRFAGKEKTLSFGMYPEVSLVQARMRRDEARAFIKAGKDPSLEKKRKKSFNLDQSNTLKALTQEWLEMKKKEWKEDTYKDVKNALKNHILPYLGDKVMNHMTSMEILEVLKKLELQNKNEIANKLRQKLDAIFRYACLSERCDKNPVINLKGTLASPKREHQKAFSKQDIPGFLVNLENYKGELITKCGIWMILYTLARTVEIRNAVWSEFELDLENPVWVIPDFKMKMGRDHVVPLSKQAVGVLNNLKQFSKGDPFIFHQLNNHKKPMSENAMLYALYRMGYHNRATIHGIRSTASTIMNEEKIRPDVIEKLLAHSSSNPVRAAYNRYDYLDERREALQWWADYLDDIIKHN